MYSDKVPLSLSLLTVNLQQKKTSLRIKRPTLFSVNIYSNRSFKWASNQIKSSFKSSLMVTGPIPMSRLLAPQWP